MSVAFSPWQQRAYDQAVAALDTGRLGHGLLICGPAGLGKRAVADRLEIAQHSAAIIGAVERCGMVPVRPVGASRFAAESGG